MKKLKVVLDWFCRIGLTGVLVIFLIFAPFTLIPNLLKAEADVNKSENYEYQGILELWHIETFEGGSVSRISFLEREAISFEKQHKGTYIVIQSMNLEQFELNIQNGKLPNMLSFGIGIGDTIAKNLVELDAGSVRSDLKQYGFYNSKQLAVPYILGGYALISQNTTQTNQDSRKSIETMVGVGLKGTSNPTKALEINQKQIANLYAESTTIDSYDAYDKFLKGNFDVLLGTQRDVFRVWNRQQKGLMSNVSFEFLSGYTDLIQYLSVVKSNILEEKLCKDFVSQIVSNQVQQKLKNYNLFSTLQDKKLYDAGAYSDFENMLRQNLRSENAFISNNQIKNQKEQSYKSVVR